MQEVRQREKDMKEQRSINVYIILSLVSVFFVNNTVFVYSSLFMFTINLFVETLSFLYMAKYFQYEGSDVVALVMQLLFFYLSHQLLKSVLKCFGTEEDEYLNLSLPEIKLNKMKSYLLSVQTAKSEEMANSNEKQLGGKQPLTPHQQLYQRIEQKIKKQGEAMPYKRKVKQPVLTQIATPEEEEACDSTVQIDNIHPMTKSESSYMKIKKVSRFMISLVEYALALANVTGSQSDIIHYCMAIYLG